MEAKIIYVGSDNGSCEQQFLSKSDNKEKVPYKSLHRLLENFSHESTPSFPLN